MRSGSSPNSTILVVGPEYSAIIAAALGLERRDRASAVRGLIALGAGFGLAIVVTGLFGLAIRGYGHVPRAYQPGVRPVSDLINSADLFSVIVAVLAGIVGVVSLTEARAGALNVVLLIVVGAVALRLQRLFWRDRTPR